MTLRRSLFALALAASAALPSGDARACGGSLSGPVYVNASNPDLPLGRFASGHLGVISPQGAWGRGYLAVAWRALTNAPLDDDERAGFVRYERRAHRSVAPLAFDPAVPVDAAPAADADVAYEPDPAPWRDERAAVTGSRGPEIANRWPSRDAWASNCLGDAFRSAALALHARAEHYGTHSDPLRTWIDAQDAVFSNCGGAGGAVPAALPPTTSARERDDRAYQIAAAHFYAGHYDEAERRFRAIAADASSPWSAVSRYLVVRTLARAAQQDRDAPDAATLDRAARELGAILADPAASAVHASARAYQGWVETLRDPSARAHELGVRVARGGLGAGFEAALHDYAQLLDMNASDPFARQPGDPDRLTTWIAVLEGRTRSLGGPAGEAALPMFRSTHATAWAVAALASHADARDPRLDAVLVAARAVPRTDPAYATAQYHRLRVLVARGQRPYEEALRVARTLTADDGPTAPNLFRELAARAAPDLERFVAAAHGTPAGYDDGDGVVVPNAAAPADVLSPAGAEVLSNRVPLASLLRAARVATLPLPLREALASAALVRAALLDDEPSFAAAASMVPRMSPEAARRLRALAEAPSRDARRLELVHLFLVVGATPLVATPAIDAVDATGDLWSLRCDRAPVAIEGAWFLTAAERAALARERARRTALGDGPTFLANEAARLARVTTADARMPALLAAAVRNTRNNGCALPAAPVHAASRASFQTLHRLYPRSAEARATPYWF